MTPDYSTLARESVSRLAEFLVSTGDNSARQRWIDRLFDDMKEVGNYDELGPLAWRANDVAVLLNKGHLPDEIRECPYRGIVAGPDDGPAPHPMAARPDRSIPPKGFKLNPHGGYTPDMDDTEVRARIACFGMPDTFAELWKNPLPGQAEIQRALAIQDIRERRFKMGLPTLSQEQLDALLDEREPGEATEEPRDPEQAHPHLWPSGDGSIAHMLHTPPPELKWLCRDRLLSNRAHLLVGVGGSSKTRALIQLAMGAVTSRLGWAWEIERTGSAVLILGEDTPDGFHRTFAAILEHGGFSHQERALLADRLHVFPLAGQDAKLLALQPGGLLVETSHFTGLLERCKRIGDLVFIGLDPALGLTEGDENSQTHQRRLGSLCDRLAIESGAAVVLVAHAAKALQSAEEVGSHSSRGGGAITDAVRAEFTLRTMTAQEARAAGITDLEERKAHVQLVATKGNELPPAAFVPTWLKRGHGGVLTQVELEQNDRGGIGKKEAKALEILRSLAAVSVPALKEWRTACQEGALLTGDSERNRERCMERIRDNLRDAGLIVPGIGRGVWLPAEHEQ